MPECKSALQEDLKAYLDGELPTARRVAVERHLTDCAACQSELEGLRLLSTTLVEALPAAAPLPDALRARILASLPESAAPRPFSLPFWRRPGPMAAFSGVLAMGCAAWLWVRTSGSATPQTSAAVEVAKTVSPAVAPQIQSTGESLAQDTGMGAPAVAALPEKKTAQMALAGVASASRPAAPVSPVKEDAERVAPKAANLPQPPLAAPRRAELDTARAGEQALAASTAEQLKLRSNSERRYIHLPEPSLSPDQAGNESLGMAKKDSSDKRSEQAIARGASGFGGGFGAKAKLAPPTAYTLTVPKGKKAETQEALRKLAAELEVDLSSESPELELRVSASGREPLLERMKALGALTETPPVTNSRPGSDQEPATRAVQKPGAQTGALGGGAGGFGGFGGGGRAMRATMPLLKLTVTIKEAEQNDEGSVQPKKVP
ncbi:zf-HC2 domain-containing protein [Armatimonas rosea]|uniref:Anti-sigma factor RsiW n=1 Tax=Armatimonas rosea TaxID=685828 RepID=A0A7W9SVW1_ARMRO|nr:anti-sigma factor RsiW [Armatimonas rosea]